MTPDRTVLVVEDDDQLRALYVEALEAAGLTVCSAPDGERALRRIAEQPPALVVLDLNMPCVDGWTVQRELASRESTRNIPVVVVSAELDIELAAMQAAAIVRKPCVVDDLVAIVHQQLAEAA